MTFNFAEKISKEDRVRARSKPEWNQAIDSALERRLRFYAVQSQESIAERLEELDREWDIERFLETNAASLSLAGIVFGTVLSRKWFILPLIVSGFLLQHALQGWCPPVPIMRRLGVRTRLEIEQERYALKLLRGDFDEIEHKPEGPLQQPERLTEALRKG